MQVPDHPSPHTLADIERGERDTQGLASEVLRCLGPGKSEQRGGNGTGGKWDPAQEGRAGRAGRAEGQRRRTSKSGGPFAPHRSRAEGKKGTPPAQQEINKEDSR